MSTFPRRRYSKFIRCRPRRAVSSSLMSHRQSNLALSSSLPFRHSFLFVGFNADRNICRANFLSRPAESRNLADPSPSTCRAAPFAAVLAAGHGRPSPASHSCVLLPARSHSQLLLYSVSDFFLFFFSLGSRPRRRRRRRRHSAAAQESRSLLAGSSFPPSLPPSPTFNL